ncbi:outer membrane beta-barrel domain-containing protein [Alteromonadaceae bacterium BrNp21-10]|nr:outer membrane beta-barrel domain-containing protein [Alteromonadaceae bacterium BrNp21-10]
MAARIQRLFLTIGVVLAFSAQAQQQSIGDIIQPDIQREDIHEANIDSEDFELGLYTGIIAIEDFSSDTVVGARLAYHISEDIFTELTYGQATAGQTSYEILSGGAPFLTEEERKFRYYDLSLGYNFNGEVFLSQDMVFNSATYFVLGAGSTKFAGDEHFTLQFGAGYRLLLTDYMALHFDVRDRMFNSEILGEEKATHNIEYTFSATFFF